MTTTLLAGICDRCWEGRHLRCTARGSCSCSHCDTRPLQKVQPKQRGPRGKRTYTTGRPGKPGPRPGGLYVERLGMEKINEIRRRLEAGEPQVAIVRDYGLHKVAVHRLKRYFKDGVL